jgi:Lrp/AsnC family leucine-responsive transcriptional regulator
MRTNGLTTLDWKILALLQENSRITVSEIASQLSRSRSNISEHFEKLQEMGVIDQFSIVANEEKLGIGISAFVRLQAESKDHRQIINQLCEKPELAECHVLTGSELVILRVVAVNMAHLRNFVDQLTEYGSTQTDIIFSTVKRQLQLTPDLKENINQHK